MYSLARDRWKQEVSGDDDKNDYFRLDLGGLHTQAVEPERMSMSVQEPTKRTDKVAIMNAVHDLPVLVARDTTSRFA